MSRNAKHVATTINLAANPTACVKMTRAATQGVNEATRDSSCPAKWACRTTAPVPVRMCTRQQIKAACPREKKVTKFIYFQSFATKC